MLKELTEQGLDYGYMLGVVRYLRPAGLSKISGKGGGKAVVHWDYPDFSNFITGLAGDQPNAAPEAVRTLCPLLHTRSFQGEIWDKPTFVPSYQRDFEKNPQDPERDLTWERFLQSQMQRLVDMDPSEREEDRKLARGDLITMTMSPPRVDVTFYMGTKYTTLVFERPSEYKNALLTLMDAQPQAPLWRRHTTQLPLTIIYAAAELLAKNPASTGGLLPQAEANANAEALGTPQHENAPDLPGSGARTRTIQPRANATGAVTSPEIREVGIKHQPYSFADVRHPSVIGKDALHHAEFPRP
ncbi:hypothetical protein [Roseomonas sp. BN140053]|uniref:hypothetical protein n=1 Tax=Roseomonas sp. BN140053 TaxID=3391898 RepID=UPI0039EC18D7